MILCLNANAAIDKTLTVPGFSVDAIHRPEAVLRLPGGKGLNVARVIHTLGGDALVLGWVGGHAGDFIRESARKEGLRVNFVSISAESRTCMSIYDPMTGQMTEVYEPGATVSPEDIGRLAARFEAHLPDVSVVTLSGSLPPGVPDDFYAHLARKAAQKNVPVFLDASGAILSRTVGQPGIRLVKPNRDEFTQWKGLQDPDLDSVQNMLRSIVREENLDVVVSLGKDGLLAARGENIWHVFTPVIGALSAVGSGDALMAGLAIGADQDWPWADCIRVGAAAAAANTLTIGAGRFSLMDYERILDEVKIETLT
jgi:tagatose 6-phosphate kinase